MLPRLKFFYTVNESLSQIYAKQAKVTPVVIRNLPLRQQGVQARSQPGNILLYQGALNEGRGIERMIAAMEHLPSCILWIVGGGPLQDALRKLATESVARDCIVFHGWVRMDQLADLTRQASLCLSMEEDRGLNYRYALPNKVLDAIQCGVPVLVSKLPEMAAIVRQHGVGECLGQEDNLAEAVNRILSDAQLWSQYQQACLKAGEELCWEGEREKLVQLLREVQLS